MRRSYVVPMRWMVIYEYEVPGGALNLSSAKHRHQGNLPLQGKIPMVEPGIEPHDQESETLTTRTRGWSFDVKLSYVFLQLQVSGDGNLITWLQSGMECFEVSGDGNLITWLESGMECFERRRRS
jgi:hypothetical protein